MEGGGDRVSSSREYILARAEQRYDSGRFSREIK